jgi:hypothetical protein
MPEFVLGPYDTIWMAGSSCMAEQTMMFTDGRTGHAGRPIWSF